MAYDKDFPDSYDVGEDRNLEGSKDKGDNNSNFLKDNSFLHSGNGCSEMHSVSEKPSQQNLGENYSHSSFTGTSNEGNDKNGDERKLEIDSRKGDLMNGKKEIDVCIETNEDGLSSAEDNVLAEIVMNEDAMQIKYEEKLDNFKEELGEKDMEESEVKRMKIGVEVSNIKIDVEKENGEEIVENLFEENVRIEEVKEVETDKVDRKEVRKIEIKCVEENEVKEGYLDKIMEIKGSGEEKAKEDYIEKDKDTKKMDQKDEELKKVEEKDEIKKDEYTKEKKLKNESNNKLYILDENEHEELLLIGNKEDEDLDETDSIDEEELLQECANMKVQKYDKELEEVDEHFKSNGKLMKDEKNPKKVIDDQLAAFFGHKTLKDGLLQTRSSLGTSTPNIKDGSLYKRVAVAGTGTPNFEDGALFKRAVSSTPNTKQDKNWSSTPISKPLLQNTPFSKSGSFCTPAQTVLKCWKPAALRRSKLFTSNTELNKSALEANTPGKFSTIQEENEDDGDDFDTSLMKLEQKLAEIENEKKLPSSDLGKSFSKIEAYHKTIVAEREEDSQKLEEVIMELSSQLFSDVRKGLVQGSQDELSVIEEGNEDEDSDLVMLEFLEGGNDGLKVVEDVDFANEQNDTVIEIDDEESLLEETQKLMIKSGVKENETLEKVMKPSSDVEFSTPDSDAEVSIQDSDVDFTTPDSDLEIISTYESPSTSDVLSGTTSSNAIISGSLSSDVSCSSMSIDSVKLVSGTESDIKPRTTFSGVMLETTSSLDVDTSEIPEPESTSRLDVVKSKVPVPESSTSADVVPASTSGLDVVESTTGSDVIESTTLSTPSDAELPTDVTAKASSSKPAQESEPNADCPTPKEPSGVSDHEERNKPFYSDDPLENLDNFNPKWEIWKNLTNDRDRYREISKRWRNMSIPNPNENLSFLKCLDDAKKRALNQVPEPMNDFNGNMNVNTGQNKKKKKNKKKRKFQEAFEPNNQIEEGPPTKRQRCTVATEIFDIEIHKLLRTLEGKRYALQSEMNAELNCLAARQERQIYDCIFNYNANHHELHFLQIKEVEQLTNFFQQKLLEAEEETSRVVTMLRMSIDEVRTFHAFYEDLQDDNGESQFITVNQLDELLETEFMVSSYQQRYGEFQ